MHKGLKFPEEFTSNTKTITRPIVDCRFDLLDGLSLLAYPTNKNAYSQLSNILTLGNQRAEKGECHLYKADIYKYKKGVKFLALPPDKLNGVFEFELSFENALKEYREAFENDLYIAASRRYQGDDSKYLYRLVQLSKELNIPIVANLFATAYTILIKI